MRWSLAGEDKAVVVKVSRDGCVTLRETGDLSRSIAAIGGLQHPLRWIKQKMDGCETHLSLLSLYQVQVLRGYYHKSSISD